MSDLISSIDPVIVVYLALGLFGTLLALHMKKYHVPDREWRKHHRT
jgi:hypothetical protein